MLFAGVGQVEDLVSRSIEDFLTSTTLNPTLPAQGESTQAHDRERNATPRFPTRRPLEVGI